ncbi:unnamed protein product [Rotaria socialis]|uniref:Uncharacterized protein n=2 Tax=Rotaria socialis TaxID=392032 RepID=A0A820XVN0_9BILA|nr:unnamed protein product [Rotaria socialis]
MKVLEKRALYLSEYQQTREPSNQRTFSLQDILFQDNEEDMARMTRIIPDMPDPVLTSDLSTSLIDVTLKNNRPISSPPVGKKTKQHAHRFRPIDLILKMKLNTRECVLLILLVISIILALLAPVVTIKLFCKSIPCNTTMTSAMNTTGTPATATTTTTTTTTTTATTTTTTTTTTTATTTATTTTTTTATTTTSTSTSTTATITTAVQLGICSYFVCNIPLQLAKGYINRVNHLIL